MEIVSAGGAMVMAKVRFAVSEPVSVTVAVKLKLPAAEGVPAIDPSELIDNPAGATPAQR